MADQADVKVRTSMPQRIMTVFLMAVAAVVAAGSTGLFGGELELGYVVLGVVGSVVIWAAQIRSLDLRDGVVTAFLYEAPGSGSQRCWLADVACIATKPAPWLQVTRDPTRFLLDAEGETLIGPIKPYGFKRGDLEAFLAAVADDIDARQAK